MDFHRVLVTAVGGNIGQGVIKALRAGKRHYHIVGVDMEPLSAGFSLVDSYYRMPRTGDPSFNDKLIEIARREKIEGIYVCSPTELEPFSIYKEELERELGLTVFVNPIDVIRIGSDKLETADFLQGEGLPYLEAVSAQDEKGLSRLIHKYNWPLLMKPRKGFSSRDLFVVDSMEKIKAVRMLVSDSIVQRYLPDDNTEYTAGTVSGPDKKVRASITLHRDLIQGTSYRTELVQDRDITDQVVSIVEALGAVGVCNIQFRLHDGKAYVFEINPRFSGTSGIRYLYGFNDPEMAFELFRLGVDIGQPELRPAAVLRYWNEIFISGATFDKLHDGTQGHRGIQKVIKRPIIERSARDLDLSHEQEKSSLDSMADRYFTQKALGPDDKQMGFIIDEILTVCRGPKVLKLGYGNGHSVLKLVDMGFDVTVVEGASQLANECRDGFGGRVKIAHSLFEEFKPEEYYDTIIASCVLEHVKDPKELLHLLTAWLAPEGSLHIAVPNALSLHRRVGLKMGLLREPMELSPQELEVGHRRSYTVDTLKAELDSAGLNVNFIKGIFLKPLSSGQMMDWPHDLLEGYNKLSDELPEYTAFIYGSCSKK
ncbi:MAG: ATP-grasp domain-containing protein [Candidatus Omnitrophica bacterium]|nr:ATP-grasp domain-containing protein [Candidatus Omnitrophota bacterium]